MNSILREPLLHFALIGALFFAAYAVMNGDAGPTGEQIVIAGAQVDDLAAQFERTWQRAPTPAELDRLIEDSVREQVLYREGVALELDRDDPVVRRRVREKVEFLTQNRVTSEPTDGELAAYLQANRDRFVVEPGYSFAQVYLQSPTQGRVAALLARLQRSGSAGPPDDLGDASLLPSTFADAREAQVIGTFGEAFTRELAQLPPGKWHGPIQSAHGSHLVLLVRRTDARQPELADVREAVSREWTREQQRQALERDYLELRKKYAVRIDRPAGGLSQPATAGAGS